MRCNLVRFTREKKIREENNFSIKDWKFLFRFDETFDNCFFFFKFPVWPLECQEHNSK